MGVPTKWEIARIFVVGTGGSGFCAEAKLSVVIGFFMAVALRLCRKQGKKLLDQSIDQYLSITTDEDGRFLALALAPGPYSVTVSKQGVATAVAEWLDLTLGQALNLPVAMKISQLQETVTITTTRIVDTVKTESSITLNQTIRKSNSNPGTQV